MTNTADPEGLAQQGHQRLKQEKNRNEKLVIQENFLIKNKI